MPCSTVLILYEFVLPEFWKRLKRPINTFTFIEIPTGTNTDVWLLVLLTVEGKWSCQMCTCTCEWRLNLWLHVYVHNVAKHPNAVLLRHIITVSTLWTLTPSLLAMNYEYRCWPLQTVCIQMKPNKNKKGLIWKQNCLTISLHIWLFWMDCFKCVDKFHV